MKQIYKVTYPTGKIYIGKDSVGSAKYFGTPQMEIINADFATLPKHIQMYYTIRKQILFESETITESELTRKEIAFIRHYQSNDPAIGYNRFPKFKSESR